MRVGKSEPETEQGLESGLVPTQAALHLWAFGCQSLLSIWPECAQLTWHGLGPSLSSQVLGARWKFHILLSAAGGSFLLRMAPDLRAAWPLPVGQGSKCRGLVSELQTTIALGGVLCSFCLREAVVFRLLDVPPR